MLLLYTKILINIKLQTLTMQTSPNFSTVSREVDLSLSLSDRIKFGDIVNVLILY